MSHLSLSFLGSFQVALGDKPLTNFRSVKVQGLLAYLALTHQQAHARDVLATLFWPDETDAIARKNLRQSLYQLRQVLGDADSLAEPHLLVTRSTVQFNTASDHTLDVAQFLDGLENGQPETAVTLYRGELLPGFRCDSLPFDEWLRQERERLHRLALDALFELTARSLAQADYPAAQRLARRQLALEPWREAAHQQLMQVLALRGDRSAALAQYETCRAVLAEEFGVAPSAETETLVAYIRHSQPEQPARYEADDGAGRQWLTTPFVGREAETNALVNTYRRAGENGLQVMTLIGQAGIGKTRLAQHFLTWAALQGADVLRGQAFETGAGLSYQPIIDLLRPRLERENAPDDLLSDLWLSQLTRILPELRDRYPDLPEPTQEESTAQQHLFEAITRLGQALAERQPLVLFIDDWHWADAASLAALHYATVRWAKNGVPILVLLTMRQEAVAAPLEVQNWLTRLDRDVATTQLELKALSEADTVQLIEALLDRLDIQPTGDEALSPIAGFSHWLFAETEGQPLFLTETLKVLVEEGVVQPDETAATWQLDRSKFEQQGGGARVVPGVQAIIRGWLDRISRQANELLTAASVLEREASFAHLCYVAGFEEVQAIEALDDLLDKQLLFEADAPSLLVSRDPVYTFSHQKISEVVYNEAGTARRRMLHRRAFETLRVSKAPSAELAHHARNAGLIAEALAYSFLAGKEALAIFAVPVAIVHFETVWHTAQQEGWPETISDAERQALYLDLGRTYELANAWPKALETYEAMLDFAGESGAATLECLALNRLAIVFMLGLQDNDRAQALLEQAYAVALRSEDQRALAETEWSLSFVARLREDAYACLEHGERAVALARDLGDPQFLAHCMTASNPVYWILRQIDKHEACVTETLQLFQEAGNLVMVVDCQRDIGSCRVRTGRPREGLATLQESFAFSQEIDNLWGMADCGWQLALALLEVGDYGQAINVARQAVKHAEGVPVPVMTEMCLLAWGIVQRTIMVLDDSPLEIQSALLASLLPKGMPNTTDWISAELCAIYALRGDWEQAHAHARQTVTLRSEASLPPMDLIFYYETEALLRGGDGDLARRELERIADLIGDNRRSQLPLLRSRAVLAQWDGDLDRATVHLQAALALAQQIGLPGEEWPILGALGGLYVEQGEAAQAQQASQEAAIIIHRLAETIDEAELRAGFLTAGPVRFVLEISEGIARQ